MTRLADVLVLAELDALASAIRDYEAQVKEIEKKGGMAGYSGNILARLKSLQTKITDHCR